jgi:hypothetical protein
MKTATAKLTALTRQVIVIPILLVKVPVTAMVSASRVRIAITVRAIVTA